MGVNTYRTFQTLTFNDGYRMFIHSVNGDNVDAVLYPPDNTDYVEYEDVDFSVIDSIKHFHNRSW